MKFHFPRLARIPMALLALGASATAEDWRDTLTTKPGKFPPLRPLTARYDFGYSGLSAARAEAVFARRRDGNFQLNTKGGTTGAARVMWQMDTTATSICNARTLRAVSLRQTETYSKKSMTTKVDFTAKGTETLRTPNPPDPTPPKVKKFKFPTVHDLHSALLFIRSQPLLAGETTRICVLPASSPYLAEITAVKREKIKVAGREWQAIRCTMQLRSIEKDFSLAPHKKFKRATAWISDDADRLFLRLEADIFVGKVWIEMKTAEFAKK